MRELVMEKVRKHFQPEFVNRIDEFIIFEPLIAEQIKTIVKLQVRFFKTIDCLAGHPCSPLLLCVFFALLLDSSVRSAHTPLP